MLVLFAFLFFLSSRLEDDYGINGIRKGWVLAIPLGALCAASFIAGKKIGENKTLMKWVIAIGGMLAGVAMMFVHFFSHLWWMIAFFSLAGIGIGVMLPCLDALITEGIEKKERGTVTSFYSSLRFIGVAAGPPLAALLMKSATSALLFLLSGLSLLGSIIVWILIKPETD